MESFFANRRIPNWLGVLALCGATLFVYRTVWNAGFIWDDDRYVTHNVLLTAPDGFRRIWFSFDAPSQYFPLTYSFLRLEHSLWGLNATGYHLVNIIFHAFNASLLWRILARVKIPGAFLTAAIFALHPVQVESVAWISELKNVLMAFFFLLTLSMWIEYVDPPGEPRSLYYFLSLAFFLLALFAKSTACTLPAALLLILWLKKKPLGAKRLWEIAPFVVLALGVGLLALWWEHYHQGTRTLGAFSPIQRLLIASRAVPFYLSKIFWPSNLTFIYPQWKIDPANPIAYIWLALCVLLAIAILGSRRFIGRGIEVSALFFVATLAPLLGFFMLYTFRYTFVADHYQYLACIGPIALACAGLTQLGNRIPGALRRILAVVILCGLGVLTWTQAATYRDAETLWRSTLSKNPDCWMAYNNLGVLEFQKGQTEAAIGEYQEALYNLASALLQKGEVDRALGASQRSLQLQPNDPDACVILGNAYMAKGDIDRAIKAYENALALRAEDSNAHYNLGAALSQKGDTARAAIEFQKARELDAKSER